MSGTKISAATSTTPQSGDLFPFARPSDTTARATDFDNIQYGALGGNFLSADANASATSITVQQAPKGVSAANLGYVVIDPYTSECEIRKVTAVSSNTFTVASLTYGHSASDPVLWVDKPTANVKWFGAKMDTTDGTDGTDDITALTRAIAQGFEVYIPEGKMLCSTAITPGADGRIRGAGCGKTFIYLPSIAGVGMYSPHDGNAHGSYLGGFTLIGDDTGSSIGLSIDDTHRPYGATWGSIEVQHFATGIKAAFPADSAYGYFNRFGTWRVNNCTGKGVSIEEGASSGNNLAACSWDAMFIDSCGDDGLYIDNTGSLGITYMALNSNGGWGLNLVKCNKLVVNGGHCESNTSGNFNIADYPDVLHFVYLGHYTAPSSDANSYTASDSRGLLIPPTQTNATWYKLAGTWEAERLLFNNTSLRQIDYPDIQGHAWYPRKTVTSGASIDVENYNVIDLSYSSGAEVTGLTNGRQGQLLLLLASNTNAYILNGGSFHLAGDADWVPTEARDMLLLYCNTTTDWREVTRGGRKTLVAGAMGSALTVSSNAITVTHSFHQVREGAGGAVNLNTINGGRDGDVLVLVGYTGETVTAKDGTGNLQLSGDFALDSPHDTLQLIYSSTSTAWLEIAHSNNS